MCVEGERKLDMTEAEQEEKTNTVRESEEGVVFGV
jgi:hypothetical protein